MAGKTLSITQIYALARSAGLSSAKAVIAAAIAEAESSGRTAVTSSNPDGGVNVGLWQLDTKGVGSGHTIAELQNPQTNAKVMASGSGNGSNWGPWATYASGAYTAYLAAAKAAEKAESSGGSGWLGDILKDIGGSVTAPIKAITGLAGSLLSLPSQVTDFLTALEKPVQGLLWFIDPANWARIIAGIFGILLLGAGLITLGLAA